MKQGYGRETPSKDEHDPADVLRAAVDNEKDEEREPQKTGDFDRCPNDRPPGRRPARAGLGEPIRACGAPVYRESFQIPNCGRPIPSCRTSPTALSVTSRKAPCDCCRA